MESRLHMTSTRSLSTTGLAKAVVLAVLVAASTSSLVAVAQQVEVAAEYKEEIPSPLLTEEEQKAVLASENHKAAKKRISTDTRYVDGILENNGNANDPRLVGFFDKYVFPSMAREENLSRLGELRAKFIKDYLNTKVVGTTRIAFINFTLDRMQKYAANPDLPEATRISAVYLIGRLESRPAVRINGQTPIPSKAGFASLKQILLSNTTPEYLKVAALAGIKRHLDVDRAVGGIVGGQDKVDLYSLAKSQIEQPATSDLAYWKQRRLMQIGGLTGDPRMVDVALGTLKSEKASLWLKYDALEAILNLPRPNPTKADETLNTLGAFLNANYKNEADYITKLTKKLVHDSLLFGDVDLEQNPSNYTSNSGGAGGSGKRGAPGGGGGGMGGGMGGGGGEGDDGGSGGFGGFADVGEAPQMVLPNYQLQTIRRRMKAVAFTTDKVVKHLAGSLAGESRNVAAKLVDELKNLLENDSNHGIVDLEEEVEEPEPGADPEPAAQEKLKSACESFAKTVRGLFGIADPDDEAKKAKPADDGIPGLPGN